MFIAIRNVCEVLTVSALDSHGDCARLYSGQNNNAMEMCYLRSMFTRIIDASRVMNIRDRHSLADLLVDDLFSRVSGGKKKR